MPALVIGTTSTFTENSYSTVGISLPLGVIAGDLIILHLECDGNNGFPLTTTDAALGFTQVGSNINSGSHTSAIYYKIAQAGEPSSYTLTCPSPGERGNVYLHVIRGALASDPIEGFTTNTGVSSSAGIFTDYTPSEDNCLVFAFLGSEKGGNSSPIAGVWPTNFTELSDNVNGPPGTGSASSSAAVATSDQTTATLCTGSVTFSAFGSGTSNYITWFVGIKSDPSAVIINSGPDKLIESNNFTVSGFGFESLQGGGKIEVTDNVVYSNSTVKVSQTIVSWSNTSVTFNFSPGSLPDGYAYIFLTSDAGVVSNGFSSAFGLLPYKQAVLDMIPGHYWVLEDATYGDSGFGDNRPMTVSVAGGGGSITTPTITEDTAACWLVDNISIRREIADVVDMNLGTMKERTFGGWIMLTGYQQSLGSIFKEGGGVQNLAFLLGLNNTLVAQMADSNIGNNVQAFSNFKLIPNRPYHIVMRYSYSENPKEFTLFIDGVKQDVTDGNPITHPQFDSHSGDVGWGQPDGSLETGGVDILYVGMEGCYYSNWFNFASSTDATQSLETSQIRDILFARGAKPQEIIATATRSSMQTALDALSGTEFPDSPHAIRISAPVGDTAIELIADNITFVPEVSIQLEWRGTGQLTWVLKNGSFIDVDKVFTPNSGTVNIVTSPSAIIKCVDTSGNPIQGARVLCKVASGGDLPFEESVTITSVGTTATVTHSSHGLYSGLNVLISGSDQAEYNGVFNITVVDDNTYTYNIISTATSPATGSINSTVVIASGDTDSDGIVSGNEVRYTSDQPATVLARKGSASPFYNQAQSNTTFTIDGIEITLFMARDE